MSDTIFIKAADGTDYRLAIFDEVKEVPGDPELLLAGYTDGTGERKAVKIPIATWHATMMATFPHLPISSRCFVVTVSRAKNGKVDIRRDVVAGWRIHGGITVPVTLNSAHDLHFMAGRAIAIEFEDKHIADTFGGVWSSIDEYVEFKKKSGFDEPVTRLPGELLMQMLDEGSLGRAHFV